MTDPCAASLWQQRHGAGAPVLLLHGLGASAHYWDDVIAATADRRMIAPDLLGFGLSSAPREAPYDMACHLAALAPLVQDGMTIVGHSTGSIVAAALAAAHPAQVQRLVLVGLPAFPDAATARAEIGRVGLLARLTVEQRAMGRLLCEAMCHVRPLAVVAAPLIVRGMPRAVAADAARHTWASYSGTLRRVVVEHRVDADLRRVQAPIVFLHGRDDRTAPVAYVEALAAGLRDDAGTVTLQLVEGDHHLPVRRPDVVARVIVSQ